MTYHSDEIRFYKIACRRMSTHFYVPFMKSILLRTYDICRLMPVRDIALKEIAKLVFANDYYKPNKEMLELIGYLIDNFKMEKKNNKMVLSGPKDVYQRINKRFEDLRIGFFERCIANYFQWADYRHPSEVKLLIFGIYKNLEDDYSKLLIRERKVIRDSYEEFYKTKFTEQSQYLDKIRQKVAPYDLRFEISDERVFLKYDLRNHSLYGRSSKRLDDEKNFYGYFSQVIPQLSLTMMTFIAASQFRRMLELHSCSEQRLAEAQAVSFVSFSITCTMISVVILDYYDVKRSVRTEDEFYGIKIVSSKCFLESLRTTGTQVVSPIAKQLSRICNLFP